MKLKFKNCHIWVMLLCFLGLSGALNAQGCPPPENLVIDIQESAPNTAFVTWDIPPSGDIVAFLLEYRIDNNPIVQEELPPTANSYIIEMPGNWSELEVNLTSICSDGSYSETQTVRKRSLILIDLVIMRYEEAPEALACSEDCSAAYHFYYRPPTLPSELTIYKRESFCRCMQMGGANFYDAELIDNCRTYAAEQIATDLYAIQHCSLVQRYKGSVISVNSKVQIYPNPVGESLVIEGVSVEDHAEIHFWDAMGKMVNKEILKADPAVIPMDALRSGVYFYQIISNKGIEYTGKINKK